MYRFELFVRCTWYKAPRNQSEFRCLRWNVKQSVFIPCRCKWKKKWGHADFSPNFLSGSLFIPDSYLISSPCSSKLFDSQIKESISRAETIWTTDISLCSGCQECIECCSHYAVSGSICRAFPFVEGPTARFLIFDDEQKTTADDRPQKHQICYVIENGKSMQLWIGALGNDAIASPLEH